MAEVWTLIPCVPKVAARRAVQAEAEGWTGILLADSQNLAAELIVEMTLCLERTERLLVAPGVANPATRHPALLAGSLATLQAESGGRVSLEIGRGDSALAYIGLAPVGLGHFRAYVKALQAYLAGEEVPFDQRFVPQGVRTIEGLDLAAGPAMSSLAWLRPEAPRVPVGVAATGPKVIALASRLTDRIALSVGADPGRVGWAIEQARAARIKDGEPQDLDVAAFVNVAVDDDLASAAQITSGKLASFSRFSVMHGTATGGANDEDAAVLQNLHGAYDMTHHGETGAKHAEQLTLDYAQRNAVIGSPEQCLERLQTLRDLGVSRFFFTENFSREDEAGLAHERLVKEVIPEVLKW